MTARDGGPHPVWWHGSVWIHRPSVVEPVAVPENRVGGVERYVRRAGRDGRHRAGQVEGQPAARRVPAGDHVQQRLVAYPEGSQQGARSLSQTRYDGRSVQVNIHNGGYGIGDGEDSGQLVRRELQRTGVEERGELAETMLVRRVNSQDRDLR